MKEMLDVGIINNTRGLHGELKITHYCDYKEVFDDFRFVNIDNREYEIEYVKYHNETVILKLIDVNSPEVAEKLKNKVIYSKREDLPQLEDNQCYISDLIGMRVDLITGEYLGEVVDVITTSPKDVFEIKKENNQIVLIPNIKEFVNNISIDERKIIITPIEGLI